MRREIELWIGTLRADLADDSFVLYNYTMEDLANPAVIRNSFSKQITLPGTTANNRIFGEIFRNDRVTQYTPTSEIGQNFDPTRKTTWRIYDAHSGLVESGYLRLDGVTRKRNTVVEYKVTLYGGLGSFLYGLAYDDNGEKRTLASLDFRGTNTPATEFNFTLNATAVRNAWTRIATATGTPSNVWDFINFAPAYNGKPTGTFDANKGIMDISAIDPAGGIDGLALVTLAKEYTEWQVKDLRSYLQRPVVRLRSVIEAACASRNNGGWTVTLDPEFFADANPYWQKTWLTLPIIDTDNIINDSGDSGGLTFSAVGGDVSILEATVPGGGDASKTYTVSLAILPVVQLQSQASGFLYMHCTDSGTTWMNYVQYTINAYDNSNNLVAQTAIRVSSIQTDASAGDEPQMDAVNTFSAGNNTTGVWDGPAIPAQLTAGGIKKVRITASTAQIVWGAESQSSPTDMQMWTNPADLGTVLDADKYTGDTSGSAYNYSVISGGRSGKSITKAVLLSGGNTPADYLVSLCKMFGLVMVADAATKKVSIEKRSTFYRDEVVDITDRIDMDAGLDKVPYSFDAKWYVWAAHYENGEWAKIYAERYGATFGQMRVDTGYSFDANAHQVLDGCVFRGAVMALENAKYYCHVSEGGHPLPSVLLDRGAKYGDKDIDVPTAGAVVTWMNPAFPSYDLFPKAQFHDKEDAPFDERDTLLFFDGMTDGSAYTLTDDTGTMLTFNNGTPCWLLQWATRVQASTAPDLPRFSRYLEVTEQHQGFIYDRSLDFGTPAEVPIPGVTFWQGATVWPAYFENYIADRYDDDSAVVTCKVNLAGMQVGPDLLRRFYWFDGAVWALNKIINHSVTTDDLTECEFVKVQDVDNYTT